MGHLLEAAEAAWRGSRDSTVHPWRALRAIEQVADQTWFYSGFANVVVRVTNDGLIVIDPGAANNAQEKFTAIRGVTHERVHTIVYTHGHTDHCFGAELYVNEARENAWPKPLVVAHEAVARRFERYTVTAGYNGIINLRQFRGGQGEPFWPTNYYPPDLTYADALSLHVGDATAELRHARGETDDATWIYFPDTDVLCTGDLFVWVVPNCGNPQKVQRFAHDWARALLEMDALGAGTLLPGHGPPIIGQDRIHQALSDTAAYLTALHDQTLKMMNEGAPLDSIVRAVQPPSKLLDRPYLQPVYDEPEFIVRNIWRLYGGWYDGVPSHLQPAPEADQARLIAELAGGVNKLVDRAVTALEADDLVLASHLADWAHFAAPQDVDAREARRRVYATRAKAARSVMARGLYRSVAVEMGDETSGSTLQT